jgi:hypothetical protein
VALVREKAKALVEAVNADTFPDLETDPTSIEQLEECLFRVVQELVAPIDGCAKRLLPLGQVTWTAPQQRESISEADPQRLRREETQARGREFDRQWQAVESAADLDHGHRVVVGEPEIGIDGPRAMHGLRTLETTS